MVFFLTIFLLKIWLALMLNMGLTLPLRCAACAQGGVYALRCDAACFECPASRRLRTFWQFVVPVLALTRKEKKRAGNQKYSHRTSTLFTPPNLTWTLAFFPTSKSPMLPGLTSRIKRTHSPPIDNPFSLATLAYLTSLVPTPPQPSGKQLPQSPES